MQKNVLTSCLCLKIYLDSWLFSRLVRHFSENLIYAFSGESVNVLSWKKGIYYCSTVGLKDT